MEFRALLQSAGGDPVMRRTQDLFFDRVYWKPAMKACETTGVDQPLGAAVVYDSHIHGSWAAVRDIVNAEHGDVPQAGGQEEWIARYVDQRRKWLTSRQSPILRQTVYRMDAFKKLIAEANWPLGLPLSVRGIRITVDLLRAGAPVRASAEEEGRRILSRRDPPLSGQDVIELQEALNARGATIVADGLFGARTEKALKDFQRSAGLRVDGIAGATTRRALSETVPTLRPRREKKVVARA
jgi:chitosanase